MRTGRRNRGWLAYAAVGAMVTSALAACSLLVQTSAEQCSTDADCARLFPGEVCSDQRVCVRVTSDAGPDVVDSGAADAADTLDVGDADCWDEAGFGGRGCYRCAPTNNEQLLNACTSYAFAPFDDETRIGGFDPADPRPALPSPDAGTDTTPDASDASDASDDGVDVSDDAVTDSGLEVGVDIGIDTGPPPPPKCPALTTLQNPVVYVGSTGLLLQPTIDALADVSTEISIVTKIVGSCDGVNALQPGGPRASGTVTILRSGKPAEVCTLDTPYVADLAGGGLFWDSCNPGVPQPADLGDLLGAVNPIGFIAPHGSTQEAISAAGAYKIYGFGAAAHVLPWGDESVLYRRNPSSANQNLVAIASGLPVDRFLGIDSHGGANMVTLVGNAPSAKLEATLGFSSSDQTDNARTLVKVLAYQHTDQHVGFYWDSEPSATDRRAVRDGHYFLWAPIHVFGRLVGGDFVGNNPELEPHRPPDLVRDLALYLTVRKQLPRGLDIIAALKDPASGSAAIPQCAMRVTRRKDSGPLEPFTPARSCSCAFEAAPPGVTPAECHRCGKDAECPAARPVCSFGYCEVD